MRRRRAPWSARALLVSVVALGGCATFRSFHALGQEQVLLTAGFALDPADTLPKRARLAALPEREIVPQVGADGEPTYVFSDPENCCCLYVGNAAQYAAYQELQARMETARSRDAEVILFGDSAMYADLPSDHPALVALPAEASGHGCPDEDQK